MCGRASIREVPLLQELAQDPLDQAALRFLALARVPGKMFVTPPDVPAARLAALRAAFAEMVRDQAFIADVAGTAQKLDPRSFAGGRADHCARLPTRRPRCSRGCARW